jgi:hypothetical protein
VPVGSSPEELRGTDQERHGNVEQGDPRRQSQAGVGKSGLRNATS